VLHHKTVFFTWIRKTVLRNFEFRAMNTDNFQVDFFSLGSLQAGAGSDQHCPPPD
jgi:hypothetical protein